MRRKLVIEFTKMHGAANDFIVIDNRFLRLPDDRLVRIVQSYADRRTGIGADGLIALSAARNDEAAVRMLYLNADGSEGTMCGNGLRCLAHAAYVGGVDMRSFTVETGAGNLPVALHKISEDGDDALVAATMDASGDVRRLDDGSYYVWTGTDHRVVLVDDVDQIDVDGMGPSLRAPSVELPNGANVNWISAHGDGYRIRTFERGVEGETMACGTGATAAARVLDDLDKNRWASIRLYANGGPLTIDLNTPIRLIGPSKRVYRGTIEIVP
jgi:diaminopimelate epimerase